MRGFRIADSRFPIFDGTGANLVGARWNSPGRSAIYTAETFAGAMLEVLVHANLDRLPRQYMYIEVQIPESISSERVSLADWLSAGLIATRSFGDQWLSELRSSVLIVPSVVTGGVETNLLLNPLHLDFAGIAVSAPKPVRWDSRLFRSGQP